MSNIPENLKYTKDHEWVRAEADGTLVVGITDYAQESLGDITYVELPVTGDRYEGGEAFGAVESVKAASDLYLPVAGEILETNAALEDAPEQVNADPYGEGWMIRIKPEDAAALESLLKAADYAELL